MRTAHVALAVAACVLVGGCTPDESQPGSKPSERVSYSESFDDAPQGFPHGTNHGVTTASANGAYTLTITEPETAHRTQLPVVKAGDDEAPVRLEVDVEAIPEGPTYGLGCWAADEGKGGYLGLVQVTKGRAAAAIIYEDSEGEWTGLQRVGEGPTAQVAGVHTIRLDCTRRGTGGTITLSVDDEELAAVDVADPLDSDGLILFSHYGGTPLASTATVRFDEVRASPHVRQAESSAKATVSEAVAGESVEIESLGLSFTLPPSFSVENEPDLVFLARSNAPPAILTIEDASASVVNHKPQRDESMERVDIGRGQAIVVQGAVVEGLPPGVAARELLVSNGSRSFTVILSAAEQDLPQLWDQLIGTVAVGQG